MVRVRAAYVPVLVGCPCFARRAPGPEEELEGSAATAGRPAVVGAEPSPTPVLATAITAIIIASAAAMFLFAG